MNVAIEGTMSKPRITGRATVRDASAIYSDFPVGLSHVNGDLVFDRSRLLFEHVTANAGRRPVNFERQPDLWRSGPDALRIFCHNAASAHSLSGGHELA